MNLATAIALATLALVPSAGIAAERPVAIQDGAGRAATLPRPAILLFWADWCAPCRNEVLQLPELTKAAAPLPVIVVPVDASPRTQYLLKALPPAQVAYVDSGGYSLLNTVAHDAAGLPVAVAVGASGEACALKLGALTPTEAMAWASKCEVTAAPP